MVNKPPFPESGIFRVHPVRPIAELLPQALAAMPPVEPGPFRASELVEMTPDAHGIFLDIRYSTTNNFLSTPIYSQARAFLQRPAMEALLRVQAALRINGLALCIFDAYRPWHITRLFRDATPIEFHDFVADPNKGSRHNRGCAVDLNIMRCRKWKSADHAKWFR